MSGAALVETARDEVVRNSVTIHSGRLALAVRVSVVGLGMLLLAATVRLYAIDAYVTIDESRWVQRASDFAAYIEHGRPAETFGCALSQCAAWSSPSPFPIMTVRWAAAPPPRSGL